jgi:hypothetical protein
MIETREDWIHGMVAVVNAFGWGRWRVAELRPDELLRVEIDNGYECAGWLQDYPQSKVPRCYLAAGGVAGLMNLLYVGDITARPELNDRAYAELFRGARSFAARASSCLACGADRCVIVASRRA